MTPLLGFTPDVSRTTEGVVTDCVNLIPYESGMEAAPSLSSIGADALAAACLGAASLTKLDGTVRVFAGTSVRLYELTAPTWTDRSAGGVDYTTTTNWQFTQFGDATIAAGFGNTLQVSTSGAFAAISGAPQAKVLFSVVTSGGGFVIAANTNSFVDQWACCGVNDHTTWPVSVATQANTGRLLGNDAGAITAGIEFGDAAILFKRRTLFVGRYVGTPNTLAFSEVAGGAGCVGPDARCIVDAGIFFVGPDQFWIFDGARPIPIADKQVRQWFYSNSNGTHRNKTICVYDREKNRVRIFYPSLSSTSGALNAQLVYHLVTKQWGRNDQTVEYAMPYIDPGVTFDSATGTFDEAAGTFDESNLDARSVAAFNTSHTLGQFNGAASDSSFTTEDVGDENEETFLTEYRLRYQQVPLTAAANAFTLDEAGGSTTFVSTISASDTPANALNKFDLRQSGRFHRVRFDFTGQCRVIGKQPELIAAGGR